MTRVRTSVIRSDWTVYRSGGVDLFDSQRNVFLIDLQPQLGPQFLGTVDTRGSKEGEEGLNVIETHNRRINSGVKGLRERQLCQYTDLGVIILTFVFTIDLEDPFQVQEEEREDTTNLRNRRYGYLSFRSMFKT